MASPCPYGRVGLSVVGFGVPVPQLVPGDLSLCLGCGVVWLWGEWSQDKHQMWGLTTFVGAARRMNPRATPTKPACAGWLVPCSTLVAP